MSAETNRKMHDLITLFQDTWAECEAFRTKQRIEDSGNKANWGDCLRASQTHAQELFQPLFSALGIYTLNPPDRSTQEKGNS